MKILLKNADVYGYGKSDLLISDSVIVDISASIDISSAADSLGEITGETVSESVVDEIFHNFCVGK